MKPFNLKEAKAGKPVVTRDGNKVRILTFDRKNGQFPIIALVDCGKEEEYFSYTIDGRFTAYSDKKHYNDLFMAPEKKEWWVNVYSDGKEAWASPTSHRTEQDARKNRMSNGNLVYIKTIKIHEEEI